MYKRVPMEQLIPSKSIAVDEDYMRVRDSIRDIRVLLHAIVVVEDGDHYYIKSGDRRYAACKELGWKNIDIQVIGDEIAKESIDDISMHENLGRANLQWWAVVELEKQWHERRISQHGQRKDGPKRPGADGWSLRDTATEIGISFGTLSEDLRLAEACMADPNIRKIKDKTTAKKIVFRKAKQIEAEAEASLPVKINVNDVFLGESSEVLKHFPDNTFDVCFTDPPWLEFKDKSLIKDDKTVLVFKEIFRVLKNPSFMYVICSTPDFYTYLTELSQIGFSCAPMPLIWHKTGVISRGTRSWEYGRDYEPILLAVKGSPALSLSGQPSSVYSSSGIHHTKSIHPNEKPVDVPMHFLDQCSYEGSIILDPFGGSGVTAEACIKMGRRYVLIERDKAFYDGIIERLKTVTK